MRSRSPALTVHKLLVIGVFCVHRLPASALKILALRCCGQIISEVWMRPATPQMLETSQSTESSLSQSASASMAQHPYPSAIILPLWLDRRRSGNPLTSQAEVVYLPV